MKGLYLASSLVLAAAASANSTDDDDKRKTEDERITSLEAEVAALKEAQDQSDGTIAGRWDGTKLTFTSADGNFTLKLGARILVDYMAVTENDDWKTEIGPAENAAGVRSGRFSLSGTVNKVFEYKFQQDIAPNAGLFRDYWLALNGTAAGQIRAGQFKEPFSLGVLQSSNYVSFMEPSGYTALVPGRNVGVQIHNHSESEAVQWAVGAFMDDGSNAALALNDGGASFTARVSGTPWNKEDGENVLHLGTSVRTRNATDGMLRYASKGPLGLSSDRAIDTGQIAASGSSSFQVEALWINGPFSVQGEFAQAFVDAKGAPNPSFPGWYVLLSYFLTGEARNYNPSAGTLARPSVDGPYPASWGAWEVVGRYGQMDLTDEAVVGGKLDDITLGVNWYMTRNTRLMLNYAHLDVSETAGGGDPSSDALMLRWQLDF